MGYLKAIEDYFEALAEVKGMAVIFLYHEWCKPIEVGGFISRDQGEIVTRYFRKAWCFKREVLLLECEPTDMVIHNVPNAINKP